VSDALGRVGQGEHSTEMKTLPNVLVLKALLNHSDKVRSAEANLGVCP